VVLLSKWSLLFPTQDLNRQATLLKEATPPRGAATALEHLLSVGYSLGRSPSQVPDPLQSINLNRIDSIQSIFQ
jgi:hypothetical protein